MPVLTGLMDSNRLEDRRWEFWSAIGLALGGHIQRVAMAARALSLIMLLVAIASSALEFEIIRSGQRALDGHRYELIKTKKAVNCDHGTFPLRRWQSPLSYAKEFPSIQYTNWSRQMLRLKYGFV